MAKLPTWHPLQKEMISLYRKFPYVVVCAGRRGGKSLTSAYIALEAALMKAWNILIMCPTHQQAFDIYSPSYLEPLTQKVLSSYPDCKINRSNHLYTYPTPNGVGVIHLRSALASNKIRGQKYDLVILDEFSMFANAVRVWEEDVQPTTADNPNSKVLFTSTPCGMNYFHQLYSRSRERDNWASLHWPTSANPYISPDKLEEIKRDLGEKAWRQEYQAEFISDGAYFKSIDDLIELNIAGGGDYTFSIDIGRDNDATVIAVWDSSNKALFDLLIPPSNSSYPEIVEFIKNAINKYQPKHIRIEKNNAGSAVIDYLRKEGIPIEEFVTTNETKRALVEDFAIGIENKKFKINGRMEELPRFRHEMSVFRSKKTPSGLPTFSAPNGYHDDTIMASILGYPLITTPKRPTRALMVGLK